MPSSAVTVTVIVFFPSFKFLFPVPDIFAFESCLFAYTFTVSTSFGTVTLYDVTDGLNPEKSFGLIPKLLKFALLDFFFVFIVF